MKDFPPPCGSSEPAPYYPPQGVGEGWEGSSGDPGVVSLQAVGDQTLNLFLSGLIYSGLQVVKITHLLAAFVAQATGLEWAKMVPRTVGRAARAPVTFGTLFRFHGTMWSRLAVSQRCGKSGHFTIRKSSTAWETYI